MRICFLAPGGDSSVKVLNGETSKYGGAEAQVAYLAAAFANRGHHVQLIYGSGGARTATQIIANVECIEAYPSWRQPNSLFRFWSTLQKARADLIYARLPDDFLWLPGLYTKLHPKSTFLYALANDSHCNPWRAFDHNSWFHNPLYAFGLRTADVIAVQHKRQCPLVNPYVKRKLVLIPNLLQSVSKHVRHFNETTIDVIWIAQVRPKKQLHVFLDVVERLPHLQFAMVGGFNGCLPPETETALKHRISTLNNLNFWGVQPADQVMKLLTSSKILVNTSSEEGFPNTMLEAWSVGVPIISLNVDPGGVIEQHTMGLVSRGSLEQITLDSERLVQTRALNIQMGQSGLAYVRQHHSLKQVFKAFEQIVPILYL